MLYMSFKGATPVEDVLLGPAPRFRIVGKALHDGNESGPLASHENRFWHIGDKCFLRCECRGAASVQFNDAERSVTYGPFRSVTVIDGAVYGNDELLATFVDDDLLWMDRRSQTIWPIMVFAEKT